MQATVTIELIFNLCRELDEQRSRGVIANGRNICAFACTVVATRARGTSVIVQADHVPRDV